MRYHQLLIVLAFTLTACALAPRVYAEPQNVLVQSKGDQKVAHGKSESKSAVTTTVATFVIKGGLPESAGQLGVFGELEQNLGQILRRLEQASSDQEVHAIILRPRNAVIGRGKLNELRSAVARARRAGKKVYADLQMATPGDYLLACACDRIVMPESGLLVLPGVRAEVTFLKGMLDKLGIEADMMQVGRYKGAAEPLTRTGMSKEFRQQYDLLVDDLYDQMVDTIAMDRKLPRKKVRQLIDSGLFTAAAAKDAGLIDEVAYDDQFRDGLKQQLAADELKLVADYGKKKVDTDFSGMLGIVKLMELFMGVDRSQRGTAKQKIAVVFAVGTITTGKSEAGLFGGQTLGSDTIVEALRKADEDDKVAAIVLRVNSPGGSALASDLIWREIRRIKKPVVASMGDVAASGGYYISMGCDQIFAEPGTLTGSIGVVGGKMAMGGLYGKAGLNTQTISRGKNSGMFSSGQRFTDSERQAMQSMMDEVYRQFVGKAADGRRMDVADLQPLAEGRVWTGRQASQHGLVDELGTLEDAITAAKRLAGIDAEEKIERLNLPRPRTFFEQMFESSATGAVRHGLDAVAPEIRQPLSDVELLRKLFAEPALLWMPYQITVR